MDVSAQTYTPPIEADSTPGKIVCAPGGVARNVAENLARLGVKTHLISVIGDDVFGQRLVDATCAAGVNVDGLVMLPQQRTATYLSLHGADGDMVSAVNDMDILQNLNLDVLRAHEFTISAAVCWVLDCNLSTQALKWLAERTVRPEIFVDAVSVAKCSRVLPWLDRIHTLKVNHLEAQALSGRSINNVVEAQSAAVHLHERGVGNVVVSMGREGVCWCDSQGVTGHRKANQMIVVNSTGAGDALLAGLVMGHLADFPLAKSVDFSMASAEITLSSEFANAPGLSVEAVYSHMSVVNHS